MMMTHTHLSYKFPNGLCNTHDKNAARWRRPTFVGLDRHRSTYWLCHILDSVAEARLRAAFAGKRLGSRRRSTKQPISSELSQDASKQSGIERKNPLKDEKGDISGQLIGSVTKGYPASDMQFLESTETETAASMIVIQLERELKRVPEEGSKVLEMENVRTKYDSKLNNINTDDRKKYNNFPVKRRPFYTHAFALFCDALESVWLRVSRSSERSGSYFLLGNFAPVEEEFGPVRVLSVKGELPACLNGEFVRAGPNPKFKPRAGYHWFDGDGMLHGLRIKDGKVTYVSRYVKTSRLAQEEYWGGAKFDRIGDMTRMTGLVAVLLYLLRLGLGVLDRSAGTGTANTALAYHNGTLLTMHEGDKPYAIRVLEDGDLETIARHDYDKKLNHWFTAHPKIDAVTGEMFTFGYRLDRPPYLTYRVVSKDGEMGDPVDITISGPVMMHDFAITENYAIFMDLPLYFSAKGTMYFCCSSRLCIAILDMVLKNRFLFSFDKTKPSRFAVLPRYAKNESQIRWFEFSSCVIFHNANAWEEGDDVVLISCRSPYINLGSMTVDDHAENETFVIEMWEYRFNMKTGEAKERRLGEFGSDFPRINDHYIGRKNRFVYTGLFQDAYHIIGVAKYDLTVEPELGKEKPVVGGNMAGIFWHGPRRYGSEPVFVPKNPGRTGDEDDGYVCSFVFDEQRQVSEVVVIDAKTMSLDPVAVIELPARIPYCFHALHVSEAELQLQKS